MTIARYSMTTMVGPPGGLLTARMPSNVASCVPLGKGRSRRRCGPDPKTRAVSDLPPGGIPPRWLEVAMRPNGRRVLDHLGQRLRTEKYTAAPLERSTFPAVGMDRDRQRARVEGQRPDRRRRDPGREHRR